MKKVRLKVKSCGCCSIRFLNVQKNQTEQILVARINDPCRQPNVIVPPTNEQFDSDILTETLKFNEHIGNVVTSPFQDGIQQWFR